MKEKRIYDRDFKETAVKLSMQRADIGALAIELGITKKLLYSWRSQYRDKGKESSQKLFNALKLSRVDGSYLKEIKKIEKQDLLILDDFGLQPLDNMSSLALMEIIEDRFARRSVIIGSQLPLEKWYEIITERTLADAVLDRLLNASHKIILRGESVRRKKR